MMMMISSPPTLIPSSTFSKASFIIISAYIENSRGDSGHPCLTPLLMISELILHLQFLLLLLDSYTVYLSFFGPSSLHLYSVIPSSTFPSSPYQMLFQNLQSKYIRYFQIPDSSRISFS